MNIISYNIIDKYNLDKIKINKLLTKKEKLIIDDKKIYFLLNIPLLDYNNSKQLNGENIQYETG